MMVKKIIDKYFSDYYKRLINNYSLHWYIDTRFVKKFGKTYFEIKKPHYKDDCYSSVYYWCDEDSLFHIVNYDESMKIIKANIEDYLRH